MLKKKNCMMPICYPITNVKAGGHQRFMQEDGLLVDSKIQAK